MMRPCLFHLSTAALLVSGSYSPSMAQSADGAVDVWGGEHVELGITRAGANLDDCATGTIDHPLVLPANGKFRATGAYTRERPGPVIGNANQARSAGLFRQDQRLIHAPGRDARERRGNGWSFRARTRPFRAGDEVPVGPEHETARRNRPGSNVS